LLLDEDALKAKPRSQRAERRELPSRLDVDLSDRLAHLVKDAGKLLARALQSRLNERSIAYGHWTFLRILWKHNGISQTRLSHLAGVMAPSTFSAVGAMEKLGYIVRKQKPSNRKNIYIFLTPAGKALEAELVPLAVEVNNIAVTGLTRKQIAEFRKALIAIIGNFEG
jgi:MarR family transcriptional regulator, organic hydroperoxide resistance regulator